MAMPMMRSETRRHFTMNCCLIAAAVVAGTAITNERGVFSPIGFNPFSATVQAFQALAGNPFGALRPLGGVPAVVPLGGVAPGPVRRGLVNALDVPPAPAPDAVGPFAGPFAAGPSTLPLQPEEIGQNGLAPGGFLPGGGAGPVTVPSAETSGSDTSTPIATPPAAPVPEPALWMSMVAGLGLIGGMLRWAATRRRHAALLRTIARR